MNMAENTPHHLINRKILDGVEAGDAAALSYAISAVENSHHAGAAVSLMNGAAGGRIPVIGFTGPPGVGKSTLINAYITHLRNAGQRVAVVAIDPSSPISGGAILGDRFRMSDHVQDPNVFVRSLSSRGAQGGVCLAIFGIIDLVDLAGWDVVLLETVGAGQADTDVADIADIKVVIQAPGMGDELQAIKAGILEIADVLVVNKADTPHADTAMRQLKAMLALKAADAPLVPVIQTVAREGVGIEKLHQAIASRRALWEGEDRNTRRSKRFQRFFAREVGQLTARALARLAPEAFAASFEPCARGESDINGIVDQIVDGLRLRLKQNSPGDGTSQKCTVA